MTKWLWIAIVLVALALGALACTNTPEPKEIITTPPGVPVPTEPIVAPTAVASPTFSSGNLNVPVVETPTTEVTESDSLVPPLNGMNYVIQDDQGWYFQFSAPDAKVMLSAVCSMSSVGVTISPSTEVGAIIVNDPNLCSQGMLLGQILEGGTVYIFKQPVKVLVGEQETTLLNNDQVYILADQQVYPFKYFDEGDSFSFEMSVSLCDIIPSDGNFYVFSCEGRPVASGELVGDSFRIRGLVTNLFEE